VMLKFKRGSIFKFLFVVFPMKHTPKLPDSCSKTVRIQFEFNKVFKFEYISKFKFIFETADGYDSGRLGEKGIEKISWNCTSKIPNMNVNVFMDISMASDMDADMDADADAEKHGYRHEC
jgi:hypothetical protein